MKKEEEYIRDYTRACSNEMDFKENGKPVYHPWLTPDHARAVAQIARQEVINKACSYLNYLLNDRVEVRVDSSLIPQLITKIEFIDNFQKAMEAGK